MSRLFRIGRLGVAALLFVAVVGFALPRPAFARHRKHSRSQLNGYVDPSLGRVHIKVKGAGATRTRRSSGFFTLRGRRLTGTHTMILRTRRHQTYVMDVTVPAGAKVTLQNVTVASDGSASAEQEDLTVEGTLSAVNCTSPDSITVTTEQGDVTMTFDPATTQIVDVSTGAVISSCTDLQSGYIGDPVKAEGQLGSGGTIVATDIELNASSEGNEGANVEFTGTVSSVAGCPNSIDVTRADGTTVTVEITGSTEISVEDSISSAQATCGSIQQGDSVKVEGTPRGNGSVVASQIEVRQNEFEAAGTIDSTDCGASPQSLSFTPDGASAAITVTMGATTSISVSGNESASCSDLTNAAASVQGVTQPDGSVAATEIQEPPDD